MKFVCNFYVYVLIIVFTRGIWVVRCSTNFKVVELKYLSEKLDPTECLKLLDAVYQRTSFKQEMARAEKIHKAIRRDFGKSLVTRENCLFQLENWHKNFPGRGNIKGREAMEEVLRYLGRPDLARQMRQNRREHFRDHILNSEDFFKDNNHDISRRYVPKNEKESAFINNKYSHRSGQEKDFRHHKFKLEGNDNGNLHPIQVITGEISNENNSEITDHNKIKKRKPEMNYDIYWIILSTVIALIIMSICATGVFVIYRKNCNQIMNGRLCQEWALNQNGKRMCVCCCGKRNETSRKYYSDVDMESGWSGRCSKCYETSRSKQETICAQKPKKLKKKRKHSRTKEKIYKKEEKKASRNKTLEKERKSQKCKRSAISESSHTDFKGRQNKIDYLVKNNCKCCKCSCTSEDQGKYRFFKKKTTACNDPLCDKFNLKNITDLSRSLDTECITSRKEKKKEKSGWSSCDTSPRLKDKKRAKEPKNKEKLFQYNSGSPCSRKTCDWRKIAKETRHGKNSV